MAAQKAEHRRQMGPSIEVYPIITVPTGCLVPLLLWPLLAAACVFRLK